MTIAVDADGAKFGDKKLQCEAPLRSVENSQFAVDLRFDAKTAFPALTFMFASPASLRNIFIFVVWPFLARREPRADEFNVKRL